MSEEHKHYCKRCNQIYDCTDDRPIDSSSRGGPADSVCFHHYGVKHLVCDPAQQKATVVVGGDVN